MRNVGVIGRLAIVALLVAALGGCGSSPPTVGSMVREYATSGDVEGDIYEGSGGDRMANLASMGAPQAVMASLMAARLCGRVLSDACDVGQDVTAAAEEYAGADGTIYTRRVLVKHDDGRLELMELYVVKKPGGGKALVDGSGETYTGGLDDFRGHNDVLGTDDYILAPSEITSIPIDGKMVAVSGHTWPTRGQLIVTIVIGVVVLLAAVLVVTRVVARRRESHVAAP